MPQFCFYRRLDGDSRLKLASGEFSDREAAREFAFDLAESVIREREADRLPAKSYIVICDAGGDDLDQILSEAF